MANLPNILFQSLTPHSTVSTGLAITFPFVSDKAPGCGYYGQSDPMHTIAYSTTQGFVGLINIQGTLEMNPSESDWYNIQGVSLGNGISPVFDQTMLVNFTGKHVWVRAVIESFTAGGLNSLTFSHN
jgi:hypothetical protein